MNYADLVDEITCRVSYMEKRAQEDLVNSPSAYNNGYLQALEHVLQQIQSAEYEYDAIKDGLDKMRNK